MANTDEILAQIAKEVSEIEKSLTAIGCLLMIIAAISLLLFFKVIL